MTAQDSNHPATESAKEARRKAHFENVERERAETDAANKLKSDAQRDKVRGGVASTLTVPAAAAAEAEVKAAQEALQAARAKSEAALAIGRQFEALRERIEKLKREIASLEHQIPEFSERTAEIFQRIYQRVGESGIRSYEPQIDELLRREKVQEIFPMVLERKRAELAEALRSAAKFASDHKIPKTQLPEGVANPT